MSQSVNNPGGRAAPPTVPAAGASKQAVWPVGLGITMIVFSVLAFMQCVGGLFTPFTMRAFEDMPGMEHMGAMGDYAWQIAGSSLILGLLAAMGCTVGVMMMMRHRRTRGVGTAWAVLKIVALIGQVFLNLALFKAMGAAMQVQFAPAWINGVSIVIVAMVFLVGSALPVFLLVWFPRRTVRAEMSSWGKPKAAPARG